MLPYQTLLKAATQRTAQAAKSDQTLPKAATQTLDNATQTVFGKQLWVDFGQT